MNTDPSARSGPGDGRSAQIVRQSDQPSDSGPDERHRPSFAALIGGPAVVLVVSIVWFYRFRTGSISFDDVGAVFGWRDPHVGLLQRSILNTGSNRWRPVFTLVGMVASLAFTDHYEWYFWFNVVLTAVAVLLLYRLLIRMGAPWIVSGIVSVVVVTSRLPFYQVTEITGLVESVSAIFLLLLVGRIIEFDRKGRTADLWWAVLLFALLIHTHERYAAVLVWLVLFVVTSSQLTWRRRVAWSGAFALPLLFNVLMKHFVFHLPLLIGTGSSSQLGFTWKTAWIFDEQANLNVLGVNYGPTAINGLVFNQFAWQYRVAAIATLAIALLFVVLSFAFAGRSVGHWWMTRGARRTITLGAVLVEAMIVSISVTIRIEPRFEFAPFLVLVLIATYAAVQLWERWPISVGLLSAIFVAGSLSLNFLYSDNLSGLYFIGARAGATQVVKITLQGKLGAQFKRYGAYVIDSNASDDWATILQPILDDNGDLGTLNIKTVPDILNVPARTNRVIYVGSPGSLQLYHPPTGGNLERYGDWWPDWVGQTDRLAGVCQQLTLSIEPFQSGPDTHVVVQTRGGYTHTYLLNRSPVVVSMSGALYGGALVLNFDHTYIPAKLHIGSDPRALAARVVATCDP